MMKSESLLFVKSTILPPDPPLLPFTVCLFIYLFIARLVSGSGCLCGLSSTLKQADEDGGWVGFLPLAWRLFQ